MASTLTNSFGSAFPTLLETLSQLRKYHYFWKCVLVANLPWMKKMDKSWVEIIIAQVVFRLTDRAWSIPALAGGSIRRIMIIVADRMFKQNSVGRPCGEQTGDWWWRRYKYGSSIPADSWGKPVTVHRRCTRGNIRTWWPSAPPITGCIVWLPFSLNAERYQLHRAGNNYSTNKPSNECPPIWQCPARYARMKITVNDQAIWLETGILPTRNWLRFTLGIINNQRNAQRWSLVPTTVAWNIAES